MDVPAGPFAGRLLTEIAKVKGGLPAAAAEMGVKPQVIDEIASGATPSAAELARTYQWLSERIELAAAEIADYNRMSAVTGDQATVDVHDPPPPGGDDLKVRVAPPRAFLPGTSGTVAILTIGIVVIILLTSLITVTLTRSQGSPTTASAAKAADADTASPAETPSSPVPATASGTPSPAAPVTASDTPSSTTLPIPSTTPVGKQISAYNDLQLSTGYGINFAAGGPRSQS